MHTQQPLSVFQLWETRSEMMLAT